ncbi:hypothetical protein CgunFtcFv8_014546 [Champsocephalus gunnari]|uniref:Uncharacterized protein n=1 Tax=Champsocephalus gunnari TaxID=52237 RepID=A0AAN8E2Y4_CHAGU|nr:hypothetical protein CgunFtcFv8_014546 [Champsocephalus gunnari]
MISVCSSWPPLPSRRQSDPSSSLTDSRLCPALTDRVQDAVKTQIDQSGPTDLRPLRRSYRASQRGAQGGMRAQISLGGLSHPFGFIPMTGNTTGCVLSGCSG